EYMQKNIQLEREVEALQAKLRKCEEKMDKMDHFITEYRSVEEPVMELQSPKSRISKQDTQDTEIGFGDNSKSSLVFHQSDTLPPTLEANAKLDQLVLKLQKENMKLEYMKEMYEEKIHDLTQQLLVVETLLDTNDDASDSEDDTSDQDD
ncbi:hypothetical protein RFI_06260, partial [Reticulomyxa filosa]